MAHEISAITPSLKWLRDLLAFFTSEQIKIPPRYRDKVIETKELLENDTSGLVNTVLDFAIKEALVQYSIETDNENLTKILNNWLKNINLKINKKENVNSVPSGLEALAKEYFRERWKGSSYLLLRTFWNNVDGMELPTVLFFVHGEDIRTFNGKKTDKSIIKPEKEKKSQPLKLGEETYSLRVSENPKDDIDLPKNKNELIFVRKPFESWGVLNPIPWIIRKGIFRNLKFLNLISQKGETIVGKALEYLFTLKKGSERLAIDGRSEFTYNQEDLQKISNDLKTLMTNRKSDTGMSTYVTNFDTAIEEFIPDYSKAVSANLYSPIEKRIMAGLGLIEIIEGVASTRRESVLNPKPLKSDIEQGIKDLKSLLHDIIQVIIEKNKVKHPKYFGTEIKVYNTPIKAFMNDRIKTLLRSVYDRGQLSPQTFTEVVGESDRDLEVKRTIDSKKNNEDIIMFPPVIQNIEAQRSPEEDEEILEDRTGPEAKNFKQALEEAECPYCGEIFDYESQTELYVGAVGCPKCGKEIKKEELLGFAPEVTKNYIRLRQRNPSDFQKDSFRIITLSKSKGIKAVIGRLKGKTTTTVQSYLFVKKLWTTKKAQAWVKEHKGSEEEMLEQGRIIGEPIDPHLTYEEAPYTKQSPPAIIKNLPPGARSIWINTFNSVFKQTHNETQARKAAWRNVKLKYKKSGDKWVRKSKGEFEQSLEDLDIEELINLKRLEIYGKQSKLINKLLKEAEEDGEEEPDENTE